MLKFAYSIINYYHEAIVQIKNSIINYFENKPEKGLVENNILLLGEHIFFTALGALFFYNEDWLYDITMMWEHNLNSSIIFYYVIILISQKQIRPFLGGAQRFIRNYSYVFVYLYYINICIFKSYY